MAPKHEVDLAMQCGSAGQIHCSPAALLFPRSTGAYFPPGTRCRLACPLPSMKVLERRHSSLAEIECLKESHFWGRVQLVSDTQTCCFCSVSIAKRCFAFSDMIFLLYRVLSLCSCIYYCVFLFWLFYFARRIKIMFLLCLKKKKRRIYLLCFCSLLAPDISVVLLEK